MLKQLRTPIQEFFHLESASGILLLISTAIALFMANSPVASWYHSVLEAKLGVMTPLLTLEKSLSHWINDGLMSVFFLIVGLEIKREILHGELSSVRSALLPVLAAAAGAAAPALIYAGFNAGTPTASGWAVPMATDIAFALGILVLMGKRVPLWAKVFLTALAVADDLFSVIIIAVFYTQTLNFTALAAAGGVIAVLALALGFRVNKLWVFLLLGLVLWIAVLKSGIHATIAGVVLAFFLPARSRSESDDVILKTEFAANLFRESASPEGTSSGKELRETALNFLNDVIKKSESPLHRLEHKLHPWVAFFIMPVFAWANAGVAFSADSFVRVFDEPVGRGIIFGLVFGKLAIFALSALFIRLGLTHLAWSAENLKVLLGVSLLAGIGFTMSIFIVNLSFTRPEQVETAKIAILAASLFSAVAGSVVFRFFSPVKETDSESAG